MSNTHVHVQTYKVMSISDVILKHFRRSLRSSGTTLVYSQCAYQFDHLGFLPKIATNHTVNLAKSLTDT